MYSDWSGCYSHDDLVACILNHNTIVMISRILFCLIHHHIVPLWHFILISEGAAPMPWLGFKPLPTSVGVNEGLVIDFKLLVRVDRDHHIANIRLQERCQNAHTHTHSLDLGMSIAIGNDSSTMLWHTNRTRIAPSNRLQG